MHLIHDGLAGKIRPEGFVQNVEPRLRRAAQHPKEQLFGHGVPAPDARLLKQPAAQALGVQQNAVHVEQNAAYHTAPPFIHGRGRPRRRGAEAPPCGA